MFEYEKMLNELTKSMEDVDQLVKSIKNKSKLVAVKRTVQRKDGKNFQQTFYVSPEEAKQMMSGKKPKVKEESKKYEPQEFKIELSPFMNAKPKMEYKDKNGNVHTLKEGSKIMVDGKEATFVGFSKQGKGQLTYIEYKSPKKDYTEEKPFLPSKLEYVMNKIRADGSRRTRKKLFGKCFK